MKSFVDRRRHVRYLAREGAFAAMQPALSWLGTIENISRGGLAFKYYLAGDPKRYPHATTMNILLNDTLYVSTVRFRIVADVELNADMSSPIRARKCRVRFNGLSGGQFQDLDAFIRMHTIGVVRDRRNRTERRLPSLIHSRPQRKGLDPESDRRTGVERRRSRVKVITFY